jgi:hypothetical protein
MASSTFSTTERPLRLLSLGKLLIKMICAYDAAKRHTYSERYVEPLPSSNG